MRTTFYRQCLLLKDVTRQRAWIPEQFAVTGNHVRIDEDHDGRLWIIVEVGDNRKSEEFLNDHERDYLGHRARTDV
jgi:hypothetical protein